MFLVLDCCSVFRCNLREFVLIKEEKDWHKAQEYCREKHSDLATVYDKNDLQEMDVEGATWIGLQSTPGKNNRQWHWSLPGVKETVIKWKEGQPDDNSGTEENCAFMENRHLEDESCDKNLYFSCYNGENICLLFCFTAVLGEKIQF